MYVYTHDIFKYPEWRSGEHRRKENGERNRWCGALTFNEDRRLELERKERELTYEIRGLNDATRHYQRLKEKLEEELNDLGTLNKYILRTQAILALLGCHKEKAIPIILGYEHHQHRLNKSSVITVINTNKSKNETKRKGDS
ncbi:hypothetical protein NDU88_000347 [Pleurodeles waltl]|uniref:Uncharacterized protein n=1 Tax=Pleurodeles waltl TaxID=8319 RepID=A0AAV7VW87_PLEWA|nr:hypothetical protein NDU88_000347 [Pleurodeles waltl]